MQKKIVGLIVCFCLMAGMLSGCDADSGNASESTEQTGNRFLDSIAESIPNEQNTAQPENTLTDDTQPEGTQDGEGTGQIQEEAGALSFGGFSFADVAGLEFYFSSGAGGWYTVLHIHEDGSFDGHFQDSDLGVTGEGYPNGTIFCSDFYGTFTEPEKIDETTYVFQIAAIEYPLGFGEEMKDGYYFDYGTAYGLDDAEDLYMYLPGAKLADLPEEYRGWVGYYYLENTTETELPFYGLYNVKEGEGFSSYDYAAADARGRAVGAWFNADLKSIELKEELQNAQTQAEMNQISYELYTTWDEALNTIWGILKENLDEESMRRLTEEERNWIAEKEAAMQEAGAEYEGGSMYSMVVNLKAAELTEERVKELLDYLPEY